MSPTGGPSSVVMRPTRGEREGVWEGVRVREAVRLGVCVPVAEGEPVPVALEEEVLLEEKEAVAEGVRVGVALRVAVCEAVFEVVGVTEDVLEGVLVREDVSVGVLVPLAVRLLVVVPLFEPEALGVPV